MYKSVLVTSDTLKSIGACSDGIEWFYKTFPKGLKISNSQEEMLDLLLSIESEMDESWVTPCESRTDEFISWFVERTCGVRSTYGTPRVHPGGATWWNDEILCYELPNMAGHLSDCELLR